MVGKEDLRVEKKHQGKPTFSVQRTRKSKGKKKTTDHLVPVPWVVGAGNLGATPRRKGRGELSGRRQKGCLGRDWPWSLTLEWGGLEGTNGKNQTTERRWELGWVQRAANNRGPVEGSGAKRLWIF